MLQNIWNLLEFKEDLDDYLHRLEEAEKSHRKLGKKWIYFISESPVQFFGWKAGYYFKD